MGKRTCSIEGCDRNHFGRGWCSMHYKRWWKHGDPLIVIQIHHKGTMEERFWAKADRSGGADACWAWLAYRDRKEYGTFHPEDRPVQASRVAWELSYGPIPDTLWVLHCCDNPPCVNPRHLFLGTPQDNVDDMWRKGRARPRGISYPPKEKTMNKIKTEGP